MDLERKKEISKSINVVWQALQDYVDNSLASDDNIVEQEQLQEAWKVLYGTLLDTMVDSP